MTTLTLPCPDCNGDGFLSVGDRHTETRTDVCPRCRGRMVIPAATGETPEASARPKAIDPGRTAYEARYAHMTLGSRVSDMPAWGDLSAEARAVWARVEAACARRAVSTEDLVAILERGFAAISKATSDELGRRIDRTTALQNEHRTAGRGIEAAACSIRAQGLREARAVFDGKALPALRAYVRAGRYTAEERPDA